jgi:hypothetical protein
MREKAQQLSIDGMQVSGRVGAKEPNSRTSCERSST